MLTWLWVKRNPYTLPVGADVDASTLEISMEVPTKGKGRDRTTLQPSLAAP